MFQSLLTSLRSKQTAKGPATLALTGVLAASPLQVAMGTPAPSATHFLETSEGRIAYEDTGSGPIVICVPSLGDLRAEYRFLTLRLVAAGYRVVAMDNRGHGESSTGWADYSVAGIGADIVALARHLNAGPVSVIGDSMAGGAAVWAAAEAPESIKGLVLIDPFVRNAGPLWLGRVLASIFSGPWGASLWGKYYASLYPTARPADFDGYLAKLRANLSDGDRLKAVREMIASSKAASEERLAHVKTPTLLLMGTKDPDFKDPAAEARLVGDRLNAQVHMIEGAGHYPHAEMPDTAAPIITRFLQQVHAHA